MNENYQNFLKNYNGNFEESSKFTIYDSKSQWKLNGLSCIDKTIIQIPDNYYLCFVSIDELSDKIWQKLIFNLMEVRLTIKYDEINYIIINYPTRTSVLALTLIQVITSLSHEECDTVFVSSYKTMNIKLFDKKTIHTVLKYSNDGDFNNKIYINIDENITSKFENYNIRLLKK